MKYWVEAKDELATVDADLERLQIFIDIWSEFYASVKTSHEQSAAKVVVSESSQVRET